jgi:diguanylate cyclase (GGDEF)-like protein
MTARTPRSHAPIVLIANSQEWHTRSLESVLGPHGYAVLRAYTGKQALERAWASNPDLIIVDVDLSDLDGLEVVRQLRADPRISDATPILVTSSGHPSRQQRLQALEAGAWDFIGSAVDAEELPLRLDAYVRAKFEADRAREESLLDAVTGLYNIRGLARRARELGSLAFRHQEPLACIVFAPVADNGDPAATETALAAAVERVGRALRDAGRISDAIGRLGPTEFAVIAGGTDDGGAVRLAERLAKLLEGELTRGEEGPHLRMAAGFDAVRNYRESPIEPSDMLVRATMAMRQSRSEQGSWIRPYQAPN